jgi:hypothetical protein
MKKLVKLFGIIALATVIGFSMIACDNGGGGGGGSITTPPPSTPASIEGTWKGSATVPRAVFTDTNWTLYMTGTGGREEDAVYGTYTYSNGTATLTSGTSWVSGGTATVSEGNKITIVIQWSGAMGGSESFGPLTKTTTPPPVSPPASIVGTWKGSATVPRATFTETGWMLYMTGTDGRDEDTQGGTYTYSNGTATLTPNSWSSGGTATVSGNSMTIVIQWTPPESFGPLTKQ